MNTTYSFPAMTVGVCYYPEHWDPSLWRNDLRRMKDAGISVIRIAEFAWSILEPEEGVFCFDFFDRALDAARYAESFRAIGIPADGYASVAEGVAAASAVAQAEGKALLCLGSLYMYGEVRAAVLGE